MPIYIYYLKSVPVFCFIGKLYIEIYLFIYREREIHLRPGRGLNSRPLKPSVSVTALTTRPFRQDNCYAFDDERNLARLPRTNSLQ